jgi:hypothetical protein
VVPNENLIAQGIPDISKELSNAVKKYAEARGAGLSAIHPAAMKSSSTRVLAPQPNCIA